MDPGRKTTEYSQLRLRQACDRDVDTLAIDGSPIITIQVNFTNNPTTGTEEQLATVEFNVRCHGFRMLV